jgi:hypothetical protein
MMQQYENYEENYVPGVIDKLNIENSDENLLSEIDRLKGILKEQERLADMYKHNYNSVVLSKTYRYSRRIIDDLIKGNAKRRLKFFYDFGYFVFTRFKNIYRRMIFRRLRVFSTFNCRVAAIVSKDTYNNLKYELNLFKLDKENYKKILKKRIDFLFVETIFEKNDGPWLGDISDTNQKFKDLIDICNEKGIKTVFFHNATTRQFLNFSGAAKLFDYIFTKYEDAVELYNDFLCHDNVFHFKKAFQPKKYIRSDKNGMSKIFTEKFFIGLEKFFGEDISGFVKNKKLSERELGERRRVYLLRNLAKDHMYTDSVKDVLSKIGIDYKKKYSKFYKNNFFIHDDEPGVSIVVASNRATSINFVFDNYSRQNYPKKELIIVLNKNSIDISKWIKMAEKYDNVRVFQLDEKKYLGDCLNFGFLKANYDYLAKFDDDDFYCENYLVDIIQAFKYTNADLIGKESIYVYFKRSDQLMLGPKSSRKWRFGNDVSGATFVFRKDVFDKVQFSKRISGTDSCFLSGVLRKGLSIYITDKYNFFVVRGKLSKHTWKRSEEEFSRKYEIVNVKDPIEYVSV